MKKLSLKCCLYLGIFSVLLLQTGRSLTAAEASSTKPAPLFPGLGNGTHAITTKSAKAQKYFDQGVALMYAFNHKEAIRSFTAATQLDADCAMAYWGIALAHGPNVNRPLTEVGAIAAWEALQQAITLKPKASAREQAYIDALAQRYQATYSADRAALDQAYAEAMRKLAHQYPDDLTAQVLFVEAVMDTMPWDYWLKGNQPKPATAEVIHVIREVLLRDPNHAGAHHLFIHLVEAGPNPELAEPSADKLAGIMPGAGHMVHMPSHIYIRVGRYHDATRINQQGMKVDREYIAHCRAQGFYPGVYYPHNMHFVWFSASVEGRSDLALDAAKTAAEFAVDALCGKADVVEAPRFRFLPQLTQVRFGQWKAVLKTPEPAATPDFVFDRGMWHYNRGLALIGLNRTDEAATHLAALEKILTGEESKLLQNYFFPATAALTIAKHHLAGKLAGAKNENNAMIVELEKAIAVQDTLPYMEPPYWDYPMRQTLGAALIEAGDYARAEQAFRDSLKEFPRNGRSLFGLSESLRRQNKTDAAASVQREFTEAWKHADVKPDLNWF